MENDLQLRVGQALTENQQLIELLVKKNTMLEEVIAEQSERLETWDRVNNADDWHDMTTIAKALNYKGFGRNKIFNFLRASNVLRYNNEPYQQFIDRGYFKVILLSFIQNGKTETKPKTVVSNKGLDFIRRQLDGLTE